MSESRSRAAPVLRPRTTSRSWCRAAPLEPSSRLPTRLPALGRRARSIPYLFHKTFPHRWITRSGGRVPIRQRRIVTCPGEGVGTIARCFSTLHAGTGVLTHFLLSPPVCSDDARILHTAGEPPAGRIQVGFMI